MFIWCALTTKKQLGETNVHEQPAECISARRLEHVAEDRDTSTPFAVHYEKIRNHLHETAINYAKRHSLARKYEHLRKSQIH